MHPVPAPCWTASPAPAQVRLFVANQQKSAAGHEVLPATVCSQQPHAESMTALGATCAALVTHQAKAARNFCSPHVTPAGRHPAVASSCWAADTLQPIWGFVILQVLPWLQA